MQQDGASNGAVTLDVIVTFSEDENRIPITLDSFSRAELPDGTARLTLSSKEISGERIIVTVLHDGDVVSNSPFEWDFRCNNDSVC